MPLRLQLMRHGHALASAPGGDAFRPLSEPGRTAVVKVARACAARTPPPRRILSSPLLRARQTADLMASLAPETPIEIVEALGPDGGIGDLRQALIAADLDGPVLVVGHQPLLGEFVAFLLGGEQVAMSPGVLAGIATATDYGRGTGRLVDLIDPAHLE